MAQEFHLKLITERAGGGDPIVRERHLPGPELSIGRAAESDIVLTDLVVDPQHAKMRFSGPGRVTIESVGGQAFEVGGKKVQRADLDVASHPVATFATYTLAFEPAPDGGAVVTVRHGEHAHYPTRSVFSLQSRVFGRRRMAWTFGAGIFLICLLVPLLLVGVLSQTKIHPDQQWSSGPLSKSHAFLETDCKACHSKSFVAVRDDSCKACHQASHDPAAEAKVLAKSKDGGSPYAAVLVWDHGAAGVPVDQQVKRLRDAAPLPAGFGPKVTAVFQRVFNHPTDRCASCHIEHTKPGQKAKGGSPGAPLSDKPDQIVQHDCVACHTNLSKTVSKTALLDTPRWLATSAGAAGHPAFRPLIMTSAGPKPTFQRMALTGAPLEKNGLIFPHREHLDKLGGVARQAIDLGPGGQYGGKALECASCHQPDASGKGFRPIEMEKDCGACHSLAYTREGGVLKSLPHGDLNKVAEAFGMYRGSGAPGGSNRMRPGTIRPTAFGGGNVSGFRAAFLPSGTCYDCHTYGAPGAADPVSLQMQPVSLADRYMPRGVFDHSPRSHGGIRGEPRPGDYKCQDCHKAETSDRSADVLIPDIAKCNACHGKPGADIAKNAFTDGECATCHSFHTPGRPTPKPGHPALESLRWTEVTAKKPAGG